MTPHYDYAVDWPHRLVSYFVVLTCGVVFYSGMLIAGTLDMHIDRADFTISRTTWLGLAAGNAALALATLFLWKRVSKEYRALGGTKDSSVITEVLFPHHGRRLALNEHSMLARVYFLSSVATLAATIAVQATNGKIEYILVNTSTLFPVLVVAMYIGVLYESYK